MVNFLKKSQHYCIGIIDIVNSSEIAASLTTKQLEKYYGLFLNIMAEVVNSHHGFVVKNIGDSLLFYFPDFSTTYTNDKFINCLDCGLEMTEMNDAINDIFKKEKLPRLNYRISADYGKVSIMKTNFSPNIDLFGGPVNMCVKINLSAKQNSMVIGKRLYDVVQNSDIFAYVPAGEYSINSEFSYPVYSVRRKHKNF
ncbi:MAG: adenylate/guanylate cyclase domain-containing protein [Nitrososphaeria archaeon]|nr:adenylate/guanylate cyclase domain-containing protein [Nitrososphaeria archaeon]